MEKVYNQILYEIASLSYKCPKPFRFGNYIYATNGNILVRFPKDRIVNYHTFEKNDMVFNLQEVFQSRNIYRNYSTKIKQSIDMTTFDEAYITTVCPDCRGDGVVEFSFEDSKGIKHYRDSGCPICDTKGEVINDKNATYKVFHSIYPCMLCYSYFDAILIGYIAVIAEMLQQEYFQLVYKDNNSSGHVFLAGDVEILLMPLIPKDYDNLLFTL